MSAFTKATKSQAKGRIAMIGVSGSGKTWTAQIWARALAGPDGRIAVIDTEAGSASKYADTFNFDTLNLESFTPRSYIAAMNDAEREGYDVLIIDSLSHAWAGKDGVLAMVDNATARSKSGNAFTSGWREVTPEHNALVDALVRCKCHLIVTMRAKTEYVINEQNGRKVPQKIGMAPVQRDGLEYEFDLVGDMDLEHTFVITKTRCAKLDGQIFRKPDAKVGEVLRDWLSDGTPVKPVPMIEPKHQLHQRRPEQPAPQDNGDQRPQSEQRQSRQEVKPDETLMDDAAFVQRWADVMAKRDFTFKEAEGLLKFFMANNHYKTLAEVSLDSRANVIAKGSAGNYDHLKGRGVAKPELASAFQVNEVKRLVGDKAIPDATIDKWLADASVERFSDMPYASIANILDFLISLPDHPPTPAKSQAKAPEATVKQTPADIAEQVKGSFANFVNLWNDAAAAPPNEWTPAQADEALRKALALVNRTGKAETTTVQWRVGYLIALREGGVELGTGKKRDAQTAGV